MGRGQYRKLHSCVTTTFIVEPLMLGLVKIGRCPRWFHGHIGTSISWCPHWGASVLDLFHELKGSIMSVVILAHSCYSTKYCRQDTPPFNTHKFANLWIFYQVWKHDHSSTLVITNYLVPVSDCGFHRPFRNDVCPSLVVSLCSARNSIICPRIYIYIDAH